MSTGVIVVPWQRGSRVRLYVRDGATTIGWVDPQNQTGELRDRERYVEFIAALHRYGVARELTLSVIAKSVQEEENTDLAGNRPGEAAFAKAAELTQGMSRFHSEIVRSLGYGSVDQTWIQGAEGERVVGTALETELVDKAHILHSIPVGNEGSDIDHLVISTKGVFSINTKNHPGSKIVCAENTVRVQGATMTKKHPYARNSRYEARRASQALSSKCGMNIPVLGVIAYIAVEVEILSNPRDGRVVHMNADHLTSWLNRQDDVYPENAVDMIFKHARWSQTWKGEKG